MVEFLFIVENLVLLDVNWDASNRWADVRPNVVDVPFKLIRERSEIFPARAKSLQNRTFSEKS